MKAIIKFLSAVAVMIALCAGFWACNEPQQPEQQEEGTEIQAVPVSDEVAQIFGTHLEYLVLKTLGDRDLFYKHDACVMINSMEELPLVDDIGNPIEYPDFDFDSHTLILGIFAEGAWGGWRLTGQNITVESERIIVNIQVEPPVLGITLGLWVPFWGLYPKLPDLPINVVRNN